MGDEYDSVAVLVEFMDQIHYLLPGFCIQIARRLISQ
jgi:hypothetical protein